MRVAVLQADHEGVPAEPGSHVGVQAGAGEGLPIEFGALLHGFVGLGDAPVQVEDLAELEVGLELPGELLLVVLDELFLHQGDDLGDFVVLVPPKLGVDFFVTVMPSVQINEAF